MGIRVFQHGDFEATRRMLKLAMSKEYLAKLNDWGARGVEALSQATPVLTGLTAKSWRYEIRRSLSSVEIIWLNDRMIEGAPLAVLLQYGHGTRQGGYVEGRDYINPATQPIFDEIADEAWEALTKR